MIKCTNCKEIYHDSVDYCPNCGAEAMNVESFFIEIVESIIFSNEATETKILLYQEE